MLFSVKLHKTQFFVVMKLGWNFHVITDLRIHTHPTLTLPCMAEFIFETIPPKTVATIHLACARTATMGI